MARLTKQDYDGMLFWYRSKSDNYASKEIDKLGRYEDVDPRPNYLRKMKQEYLKYKELEERIGIDLATLLKGLADGIFYKIRAANKIYYERQPKLEIAPIFNLTFEIRVSNNTVFDVVDYGKTWALTAEELE